MSSALRSALRPPERAFLPAALEIVETPPSPIGRLGGYVLISVFAFAMSWASIGKVDIVAVAKGKIVPTGRSKVVQAFDTGVVSAIHVRDGQKVQAGDLLLELDPALNQADLDHLKNDLMAAKIDVARLTAALRSDTEPATVFIAPPGANIDQANMGDQYFRGQVSQYRSKLASMTAEETQKRAELDSLKTAIGKIDAILPMMQERAQMRKTLLDHQNGSRITYLESLQELVSNQQEREVQVSHLKEAGAAIIAANARREETEADYRRAILSDLAEATRKAIGLEQDVAKVEKRSRYQSLKSPISGTVQQLALHTVGGVVTSAQPLLVIVPSDNAMEVEALVENQDIGFVHAGQAVEIKIDTFNFTRYGLRHGVVVSVSQDAVGNESLGKPDPEATQTSEGIRNQEPKFSARVSLDSTQMQVDDKFVNLTPGMAVTVEIKTGTRRIISYLLSPLLRYSQESLRER